MADEDLDGPFTWKQWTTSVIILLFLFGLLAVGNLLWFYKTKVYLIWSLMGVLFGTMVFWSGWKTFRTRQLVRDTPTSTVRGLAVGAAEVQGEARPLEEPLTSPMTHEDAVLYRLQVERNDGDEGWQTVLDRRDWVPFHVDDGTGAVRVDPEKATLELETEEQVRVGGGARPPDPVREWARSEGIDGSEDPAADDGGSGGLGDQLADALSENPAQHLLDHSLAPRRYTETILAPGEETYVLGGAEPREEEASPENARNLVMRRHPGTGAFRLSDRPQEDLVSQKLAGTVAQLGVGVVALGAGILGTMRWAGAL